MTLTEFLLARLDADPFEEWARLMARNVREEGDCRYTRVAALIYADHPDFDARWAL